MKTIFDPSVRAELAKRIDALDSNKAPLWGKMTVCQMVRHCTFWDEWVQGKTNLEYRQEFMGRIFGKMVLRSSVKDDRPLKKSMPAGRNFIFKETKGDVDSLKKIWSGRIAEYEHYSNPDFIHDFFGRMTNKQIGIFAYKHADHHLRQFGC